MSEQRGWFDDDYDSDDFDRDEDDDLMDECGLMDGGQCMMAGTEHCDFSCPMRDSELFAGSRAFCWKHSQLYFAEVSLARHALGLDGKRKESYRNRFVAGESHGDYGAWMDMCKKGLAVRIDNRATFGGDWLFVLTRDGAEQALYEDETLSPEDFPKKD